MFEQNHLQGFQLRRLAEWLAGFYACLHLTVGVILSVHHHSFVFVHEHVGWTFLMPCILYHMITIYTVYNMWLVYHWCAPTSTEGILPAIWSIYLTILPHLGRFGGPCWSTASVVPTWFDMDWNSCCFFILLGGLLWNPLNEIDIRVSPGSNRVQ